MAIDSKQTTLLEEVLNIHQFSESLHRKIERVAEFVSTRRRGIGGSHVSFVAQSRTERDANAQTDRQKAIHALKSFEVEVLPFLYGKRNAPSGTLCPTKKLCS